MTSDGLGARTASGCGRRRARRKTRGTGSVRGVRPDGPPGLSGACLATHWRPDGALGTGPTSSLNPVMPSLTYRGTRHDPAVLKPARKPVWTAGRRRGHGGSVRARGASPSRGDRRPASCQGCRNARHRAVSSRGQLALRTRRPLLLKPQLRTPVTGRRRQLYPPVPENSV